jgi:hypothetical protein
MDIIGIRPTHITKTGTISLSNQIMASIIHETGGTA